MTRRMKILLGALVALLGLFIMLQRVPWRSEGRSIPAGTTARGPYTCGAPFPVS